MVDDERPVVYVHDSPTSSDDVRVFYEVPRSIADRIQPEGERRTFVQCLRGVLDSQPAPEEDWMEAARNAYWAFQSLAEASNPRAEAEALITLSNDMFDLITFLPDYEPRTGRLKDDDD